MSNKSFIVIEKVEDGFSIVLKSLSGKQVKSKNTYPVLSQAAEKALDYKKLCSNMQANEVCCVMF